jgi:AraC-like DNA-binding protein
MYEQEFQADILYLMFYAGVAVLTLVASCYLLFRRGNAFAPDITPPARLRRWAAAFFAALALCHLWYLPIYFLSSSADVMLGFHIAGLFDCLTVFPLSVVVLLVMLQDRRRPLWPVWVMMAPFVAGRLWSIATCSDALVPILFGCFMLVCIGLIIYMVRATRQYGRWLRDNYADLEHKEVWQSIVVLAVILSAFLIYSFDIGELIYEYAMEVIIIVLICYLLWRIETLSDLSISEPQSLPADETVAEDTEDHTQPMTIQYKIMPLLQKYCIDTQLYLQHDLTLLQLAKVIGTNRSYLSQYFSSQGMTYNAYINGLRIQHFINLYHEAAANSQPMSIQQLAHQSGFRSYSTFNAAFKQSMGMTATEWMRPSES